MAGNLEQAVDWIVDGHVDEFRQDFSVIQTHFPNLGDADLGVLREIHSKGMVAWEQQADVVGQRSYGWADQISK